MLQLLSVYISCLSDLWTFASIATTDASDSTQLIFQLLLQTFSKQAVSCRTVNQSHSLSVNRRSVSYYPDVWRPM